MRAGEATDDTLENGCEVWVVAPGVPELHMLVCPPGDSCCCKRNLDLCAVGVVVKQLQRVCEESSWLIRKDSSTLSPY